MHHKQPNLQIKLWDDAKPISLAIAFFGEFIGTFLLVFLACGFSFVTDTYPNEKAALAVHPLLPHQNATNAINGPFTDGLLRNGFAVGIIIAGVVLTIGPISGAHVNPAVSTAFLLLGKVSVIRAFGYIFSQILGAVAASTLLLGSLSDVAGSQKPFACTFPSIYPDFPAAAIEAAATFVLVFTILTLCHITEKSGAPPNKPPYLLAAGIVIAVTLLVYVAGPFSGASMNPARSFGPAVVWSCWRHHHVYWFGPLSGSVLSAAVFYVFNMHVGDEKSCADKDSIAESSSSSKSKSNDDPERQALLPSN